MSIILVPITGGVRSSTGPASLKKIYIYVPLFTKNVKIELKCFGSKSIIIFKKVINIILFTCSFILL